MICWRIYSVDPRITASWIAVFASGWLFFGYLVLLRLGVSFPFIGAVSIFHLILLVLFITYMNSGSRSPALPWLIAVPVVCVFFLKGRVRFASLAVLFVGYLAIYLQVVSGHALPHDFPAEAATRITYDSAFGAMLYTTVVAYVFFTQYRTSERTLYQLSRKDPLTGVDNRRLFMELAAREAAVAVRSNVPMTLLMLDIDHFKLINDQNGHKAGDDVLCAFARACRGVLRNSDVFARIGGEEFAALLPNTRIDKAREVAERLRCAVERIGTEVSAGVRCKVTVSIGMAQFSGLGDSVDRVLNRADRALYAAKEAGRNRVMAA